VVARLNGINSSAASVRPSLPAAKIASTLTRSMMMTKRERDRERERVRKTCLEKENGVAE
jgi:hypothetical protein